MKKLIRHHLDKWSGVFTDTDDPSPPDEGTPPPPEPQFGGTEPPVYTDFCRPAFFNI
ncbi:MAG TPA: hypothetical protein VK674_07525 [Candidatus Limnocylindria bacterium]|nr:hypothetical protein [Candidatus Limnocylindria bacterium]